MEGQSVHGFWSPENSTRSIVLGVGRGGNPHRFCVLLCSKARSVSLGCLGHLSALCFLLSVFVVAFWEIFMYTGKVGVGIFVFDRPWYFKMTMGFLERSTYLENTDFHFFFDGAVNRYSKRVAADPKNIMKCVDIAVKSALPNKYYHIRDENVGIAIQQFEGYEWMTSRYKVVCMVEDDVLLSPHGFRILRILLDSVGSNAFSVGPSFERRCAESEVRDNLDKVKSHLYHDLVEMFWSDRWWKIRGYFLDYYNLVNNVDYKLRDAEKITTWFRSVGFMGGYTSQDYAKDYAVYKAGMARFKPVVNRSFYIGERGTHSNPEWYAWCRWGEFRPIIFPEDETMDKFYIVD